MHENQPLAAVHQGPRPPLWLPEGSVRAILALAIFGSVLATLVLARRPVDDSFWLLWMLNYAVLAYYFAMRRVEPCASAPGGGPTDSASPGMRPLSLPPGTVRWCLLLAFVATCAFLLYKWFTEGRPFWQDRAFFPMLSLGGFFAGRLLAAFYRHRSGPFPPSLQAFEHGKAAVALLCACIIVLLLPLEISLPASPQLLRFAILFIFFYFGAR